MTVVVVLCVVGDSYWYVSLVKVVVTCVIDDSCCFVSLV